MKSWFSFSSAVIAVLGGLICPPSALAQDRKSYELYTNAVALAQAGRLAEAETPVNALLAQANDQVAQLLMFRASLRVQTGRFQDAAADLEQIIQINPANHWSWFVSMPVLVQAGDIAKYRAQCKEMLRRFGDTTDPDIAERVSKTCLLLPAALDSDDSTRAAKLADNCVALTKKGEFSPYRRMAKGLAEYRRGKFASASELIDLLQLELSEPVNAGSYDDCRACACFISAMAHQQLKETNRARAALNVGREIVRTKLVNAEGKHLTQAWWTVLLTQIWMSEAIKTVGASEPAP